MTDLSKRVMSDADIIQVRIKRKAPARELQKKNECQKLADCQVRIGEQAMAVVGEIQKEVPKGCVRFRAAGFPDCEMNSVFVGTKVQSTWFGLGSKKIEMTKEVVNRNISLIFGCHLKANRWRNLRYLPYLHVGRFAS